MTYETKADPLDASFTAAAAMPDTSGDLAMVRAEVAQLAHLVKTNTVSKPALQGAKADGQAVRTAFAQDYVRQGLGGGDGAKAMSIGIGPKGGVAVPYEIDAVIGSVLKAESPIRQIAQVVEIGTANYRKLVATNGVVSGWAAETAGRAETETPDFAEIAPPMGDLYANPAASQAMLDDAFFNVEEWLGQEIGREFARAEGTAFISGNGTSKPKGFLTYPVSGAIDTGRPFGTLQAVNSGAAGGFAATTPQDKLIDLVHALSAGYRQGASWVMNSATLARIRKMKDGDGAFLWQPALAADRAATLLGYPVIEADAMPDIAADSLSIAFGNFQAGYLIVQRPETQVLRDPFTNKPFVHFYATRRVGGALLDSNAIKLMKFAA